LPRARSYYSYRNPQNGVSTGLGSNFEFAKKAVQEINAKRTAEPVARIVARIEKPRRTLGEHLIWYDEEVLRKQVSPKGKPRPGRQRGGAGLCDEDLQRAAMPLQRYV
jgi:hypothetical protein